MASVTSFPQEVLVVDDEPVVLHVVSKLLTSRGLPVAPVATAEAALELINQRGFALMITDKNLPGMDGVELMRRLRKKHPYCGTIVMTGYASMASAIEALRLGANDYLEKPFSDLTVVAAKVENAIKAQRTSFERDALAERLRTYQAELEATRAETQKQRTEIELFEELLDSRVKQATAALRQDLEKLQAMLARGQDSTFAVRIHAESVLEAVREAQNSPEPHMVAARGAFAKIAVRLETHLGLLKHLTAAPAPGTKAA